MRERVVVVGTDSTAIGDAVVRQGAVLAEAMGATLHVVAITGNSMSPPRAAVCHGVRAELHDASGDLTVEVAALARGLDADVVILDRTPRTALGRAVSRLRWRLAPGTPRPVRVIALREDSASLASPTAVSVPSPARVRLRRGMRRRARASGLANR